MFKNTGSFTDEQVKMFSDQRMLAMMKILMKADSSSYCHVYDKFGKIEEFMSDIEENNKSMVKLV
jgi:hypothetical protein